MNLQQEWAKINEEKIKEVERTEYNGEMPQHNKQTMRQMLAREDAEVLREEREHSHSPVGDRFNMRISE